MDRFQRWDDAYFKFSENVAWYISGTLVLGSMVYTAVNVVARYVFKFPLPGMTEYVGIALVPLVYMGLSFTWYKHAYISIGIWTDRLNPKGKTLYWVQIIYLSVTIIIFTLLTIWGSILNLTKAIEIGRVVGPAGYYSKIWPWLVAIPVGTTLLLIRQVTDLISAIRYHEHALPKVQERRL